jgi:DNA gyrase subunit A
MGQAVRIPMTDVRVMGRSTQGVRLVNMKEDKDFVVGAQKIEAVAVDVDEVVQP